ncbi:hypothetical protein BOCO_0029 [Bombiscardovia coagulans]|uniref:Uncharacterized protein n=1 Tax=Bombiscardovia coagulans TaxID=686666 RepID=A0A261EVG7_9BIFI|nr:hypothetical protein BOCO_0029 [Bombiscardovia coagulans]
MATHSNVKHGFYIKGSRVQIPPARRDSNDSKAAEPWNFLYAPNRAHIGHMALAFGHIQAHSGRTVLQRINAATSSGRYLTNQVHLPNGSVQTKYWEGEDLREPVHMNAYHFSYRLIHLGTHQSVT